MTSPNIQLVSAIFANDSSKIRLLLDQGIDLNDCGFFNIPPLIRAVLYGKSKAIQAMIEGGADKNIKDKKIKKKPAMALQAPQNYAGNKNEFILVFLMDSTVIFWKLVEQVVIPAEAGMKYCSALP